MKRTCLTELHEIDANGRVVGVTLCRHEMRIAARDRHGYEALPSWVCLNERCETVVRATPEDLP